MPKDDDMQRTLVAEFPPGFAEYNNTVPNEWFMDAAYGSWERVSDGFFVTQQDIDLSGYALDKKTFYPYSSFEQRGSATAGNFTQTLTQQPYVYEMTVLSSVPLKSTDLAAGLVGYAPGFMVASGFTDDQGRFNRDVIIHGEVKYWTVDSTLSVPGGNNLLKLLEREVFSSLEPTAADKIYCYRAILISTARDEGVTVTMPPTRVLLPGNVAKEPQLEYMMRLKRSYELANQL